MVVEGRSHCRTKYNP